MRRAILPVPALQIGVTGRGVGPVVHLVPGDVRQDITEHIVEGATVCRLAAGRRV